LTTTDLTTDHSRAKADGTHSHGLASTPPNSSRADRPKSFDLDAFPVPNGREEQWRFSAVRDLAPLFVDHAVDGALAWSVSELPAGVTLTEVSVEDARERSVSAPGDRASAIAAAHSGGAKALTIAPSSVIDEPVTITMHGDGSDARSHLLVEVGANAEVSIVIERTGSATYSEFISVDVGQNAGLNLVLLQTWEDDAIHSGEVHARLSRDARLRGSVVTLGGKVVRLNTTASLAGVGSSVDLFGLYFADSGQHQEHQLFVDHMVPKCRSRVTYKGALAGASARTVWIGDVLIRKEAEGTDTYELNRNLILNDGARADSVPNLEIETGLIDGAGHASATGRFDDEQMFYLRSRGIPEILARKLVVRGFFADLIREIGVPEVEVGLMNAIELELDMVEADDE